MPTLDAIVAACPPDTSRARLEAAGPWPVALVATATGWVTVHSRRDPLAEARRVAEGIADDLPVVVVIGLGLGYLLDALEERGWQGRVLALEPEPALVPLFWQRRDWRAWQERLVLIPAHSEPGAGELSRRLAGLTVAPVPVVNSVLARVRNAEVRALEAVVARAWFDHEANEHARRENAGRYLLNTLRNLPAIAREGDAGWLRGTLTGSPVIVVGAGPSLDRNMDDLRAVRDRAIVIAVDTALRPMLGAGLPPDIVVAVDPSENNARHLCELPPCPDTWLVAEGSLDPEALVHFAGRTLFCRIADHHPWPWLRAAGLDRGLLRAWGSVLTTAFDLALVAGAPLIALAGADLAFTAGQPYARGTTNEEDWRRAVAWGVPLERAWADQVAAWRPFEAPSVDGGTVQTARHLVAFRDWIAEQAAARPDVPVINASGWGILHGPAIRQCPLGEALAGWPRRTGGLGVLEGRHGRRPILPPEPVTAPVAEWVAWAPRATASDVEAALGLTPSSPVVPVTGASAWVGLADAAQAAIAAATPNDRAIIERLLLRHADACAVVVNEDPRIPLAPRLLEALDGLPAAGALLVLDRSHTSSGAQMRRGVEHVLAERPAAWLEYHRFVDRASRLAVLYPEGSEDGVAAGVASADAAKSGASELATAERLVPLVVSHLSPGSLVDLGAGQGQWAAAARRAQVPVVDAVRLADVSHWHPPRRYDVCLLIEVVQHLPLEGQAVAIAQATAASDVVVFSSAPPGTPGANRLARPLRWWARLFWQHGYVLDDSLRALVEQACGAPTALADALIIFRRQAGPIPVAEDGGPPQWMMHLADRIHDLYMQTVWLQADLAEMAMPAPLSDLASVPIPPRRLLAADGGRIFRVRSDAARWYLSHPAARLEVLEDGRPLPRRPAGTRATADGGWWIRLDEITILAADGGDARTNGREYTLRLPAHVAAAEVDAVLGGAP